MENPSAIRSDAFDDIRRAVRRRYGARAAIADVTVATLGGSNRTVIFDLVEGAARRRLVSRQETYTSENSPFLPPSDQFKVMKLVHANGFPVPEPVFEYDAADGMGNGYVTAYVAGDTMPRRILSDPTYDDVRPRLAAQFGDLLALLHSLDTSAVSFLETWPDSIDPLEALRQRYDSYRESHPAIEMGLRWLERNRPAPPRRRLVHGDFRVGNFMVDRTGVSAVLDWECSHIGSGMEDLGWLCMRSWRFGNVDRPVGGVGDRSALYEAYRARAGSPVDTDAVRYWEIFGLARWAVLNMMQAYGHVFGGRRSVIYAACGRNTSMIEYDLLMTLAGRYS